MSRKSDFYIYAYFRPNGTPVYIGKGRACRWRRHLFDSHNSRLARIVKAAGGELPHAKIRENLTSENACEIEVALIAAIGRGKLGPLVNMTDGGEGMAGHHPSDSGKQSQKAGLAAYWASPAGVERKRLQSIKAKAQMTRPDQKDRFIARIKGNKFSTGRKLSDERKRQISATVASANRTRVHTEESRAKNRAVMNNLWDTRRDDMLARESAP